MRLHAMHARTCAADALLRLRKREESSQMRESANAIALEIAAFIADTARRGAFLGAYLQRGTA